MLIKSITIISSNGDLLKSFKSYLARVFFLKSMKLWQKVSGVEGTSHFRILMLKTCLRVLLPVLNRTYIFAIKSVHGHFQRDFVRIADVADGSIVLAELVVGFFGSMMIATESKGTLFSSHPNFSVLLLLQARRNEKELKVKPATRFKYFQYLLTKK